MIIDAEICNPCLQRVDDKYMHVEQELLATNEMRAYLKEVCEPRLCKLLGLCN